MWQRFTERARRVVFFAQEEAGRLGENHVSTEHLLLGILRDDNRASQLFHRLDVSLERLRAELEKQAARGDGRTNADMELAPRAKRVLDLAYDEARLLNNNFIGTEHLLLGLIREGEGLAGRVLHKFGMDLKRTQQELMIMQEEAELDAPAEREAAAKAAPLRPGDLGVAGAAKRGETEIALDARAYVALAAIFAAKDTHGYQQMASGDQTLFLIPNQTPLKRLVSIEDAAPAAEEIGGVYVRVLAGPYAGAAGWMNRADFERTGPDTADFPPPV